MTKNQKIKYFGASDPEKKKNISTEELRCKIRWLFCYMKKYNDGKQQKAIKMYIYRYNAKSPYNNNIFLGTFAY